MSLVIILLIAAYLIGSVNFSIILFIILGKNDPRKQFSGNAGVTNVYRQAGFFWAALVLIIEISKAVLFAYLSLKLLPTDYVPFIGFTLVIGNRYTCFHGFKGGKGVAAYLGFTSIITPLYTGISLLGWVIMFKIFKLPFLASFVMVCILSFGTVIYSSFKLVPVLGVFLTAMFIFFNHKSNITELIRQR